MRILVFTVTAWNSRVGANTWESLLSQYKDNPDVEIANICIRDEIPDSKICSEYFTISESRMIRSFFNRNIKTGLRVTAQELPNDYDEYLDEHNKRYVKMTRHRWYSMLMARELIWKAGKWKTKELDEFIDSFNPDLILHGMEGYIHLNRIIEYAIKRSGAKAIGYIMDDNFTYKQSNKLGYKILRFYQKKSLKRLANLTNSFFSISPMTKKEADEVFKIDSTVLTKPLNAIPQYNEKQLNKPINILYTGNLLIGREDSLVKLVNELKKINEKEIYYTVDVYTSTVMNQKNAEALDVGFVKIHNAIEQQEVFKKQKEADLLLFLEDINGKDAKTARLSFSTKLTDYLSTGNAIFAVGNKETAPFNYLIDNNIAFVADNEKAIERNLLDILDNPLIINKIRKNVCECAVKNHKANVIHATFDKVVRGNFELRSKK